MYAACGTRESVIPRGSQALISGFSRNRTNTEYRALNTNLICKEIEL